VNNVRAKRNRTITLSRVEEDHYGRELTHVTESARIDVLGNCILNQDVLEAAALLPNAFVDLLILDPPYNLTKTFASTAFKKKSVAGYAEWFESLLVKLLPLLKKTASVYVCSEWCSSTAAHLVLDKFLKVRNRKTILPARRKTPAAG